MIREVVGKEKMKETSLEASLKPWPTDPPGQRVTGVKYNAWEAKMLLQKICYGHKWNPLDV